MNFVYLFTGDSPKEYIKSKNFTITFDRSRRDHDQCIRINKITTKETLKSGSSDLVSHLEFHREIFKTKDV